MARYATQSEKSTATTATNKSSLLDGLVIQAVKSRATDVHIEPRQDGVRIRWRVDGAMVQGKDLPSETAVALISRLKVRASLDIADRRAQNGTFTVSRPGLPDIAVRCSTFPGAMGEKMVLKVTGAHAVRPLHQLGMTRKQIKTVRDFTSLSSGLVMVTAPAGSGTTTTLYAMLRELDSARRNVVTLEDPVEALLPDLTQGQIDPRSGFTYAEGLRAVMRQDPDIIMVGDMSDPETAELAIRASLSGKLVFASFRAHSTLETITRLLDIGVEPAFVANALQGVVCERLVRRVCEKCGEPYVLDKDLKPVVGFEVKLGTKLVRAVGCDHCLSSGYRGRTGLFEVLVIDDRLRKLIKQRRGREELKKVARELGVASLRRVGIAKAGEGMTTVDEVVRVT